MQIAPGEIHVWYTPADLDAAVVPAYEMLLTAEERAKAARLLNPADRRTSIVARAALRLMLARYAGVDARTVSIVALERGKPAAPDLGIEFSVTHSGTLVGLAFSTTAAVGIDVERHREVREAEAIANRYFSDEEQRALADGSADAFLRIWVQREALGKAMGTGIAAAPPPAHTVRGEWSVLPLPDPLPGYVAAVAARMSQPATRISWLDLSKISH